MSVVVRPSDGPHLFGVSDVGCSLYLSCRTCPFGQCLHEAGVRRNMLRADVRAQVVRARRWRGAPVEEIAEALGVSRRTVFRLLKRPRPKYAMSRSQRVLPVGGGREIWRADEQVRPTGVSRPPLDHR